VSANTEFLIKWSATNTYYIKPKVSIVHHPTPALKAIPILQ